MMLIWIIEKLLSPENAWSTRKNKLKSSKVKVDYLYLRLIERENEISKNNAFLIRNLLEISHGKRVSFTKEIDDGIEYSENTNNG